MNNAQHPSSRPLTWTRSSYSGGNNNCVEVAAGQVPSAMPVRDSKRPAGPALLIPAHAWSAFINGVQTGDVA